MKRTLTMIAVLASLGLATAPAQVAGSRRRAHSIRAMKEEVMAGA